MIKKFDLYHDGEYYANTSVESETGGWVRVDVAENLYECLKVAIMVLEGILEDPEVMNVSGCHIEQTDIDDMKRALKLAEESA